MFGDIDCRSAIFPAKRQSLKTAHEQEQPCRPDTRSFKSRQQTDRCSGNAHQGDCDKKRIFPANLVAEISKQYRAERPHAETCTKNCKRRQCRSGRVVGGKKQLPDQRCQYAVYEEIIPFEYGT